MIVTGDFGLAGGMDKANYYLAWYLAEQVGAPVHLVSHTIAEPLASHTRVTVHRVKRPFGRYILGDMLLDRTGRRLAAQLIRADPKTRVIVNGTNCRWPGINWVHMVHHTFLC